jgi:hypothetical protein
MPLMARLCLNVLGSLDTAKAISATPTTIAATTLIIISSFLLDTEEEDLKRFR